MINYKATILFKLVNIWEGILNKIKNKFKELKKGKLSLKTLTGIGRKIWPLHL